jgi:hypothetical protein
LSTFSKKPSIVKFSILIILILISSLAIVYFVNDWFRSNYDPDTKQRNWYAQHSDTNEEKIFLVGSSYVMRLNATVIENVLKTNNQNFTVYNLAISADKETDRIRFIDDIIKSHPRVVVFGVGYFSFVTNSGVEIDSISENTNLYTYLPDIQTIFKDGLNDFGSYFDFSNFQNPKLTSLSLINNAIGEKKIPTIYSPLYKKNQPFSIDFANLQVPKNSTSLEKSTDYQYLYKDLPSIKKPNIVALKKMVKDLEDNNIKTIVYITPYHKIFWEGLDESKYQIFLTEKTKLADELGFEIYDLHNKYSEYNIWYDFSHISKSDNHYSDDIAKFILRELVSEEQIYPITYMNDTTSSFGVVTNNERQLNAEFVSPNSQLVGKQIDAITLKLRKIGSPTGTAQIGVFNDDLSVKKLFGTIESESLFEYYSEFSFSIPKSELYTIEDGDKIGIKYPNGDMSNYVNVLIDNTATDPFDGANSYYTYYKDEWLSFKDNDITMKLTQSHPNLGEDLGVN